MEISSDICPQTLSVPRSVQFSESIAQGRMSLEEQIVPKDKYSSIFLHQMEAILFIILQIFLAAHMGFKTGEFPRIFPS